MAEKRKSERAKKMFVLNRDAVRELRRQLAPVVALLRDDKERVVRLVSYMRRGQATIGSGGAVTSASSDDDSQAQQQPPPPSSLFSWALSMVWSTTTAQQQQQRPAAAASATSSNNNTDDESSSMQLSAADCGEWLLGRVLSALLLLLLANKKSEKNNDDDDDATDDDSDGEKKATNEVRCSLLAAGVDEATVEQTVKELNWKVRAQRAVVFVVFVRCCLFANTHTTTCLYVF